MNRFAYYMSGYTLKAFSGFSKARVSIHGQENIPDASVIFTANHFTRMETIFLPYHIHGLIKKPVWSLASSDLFHGALKGILSSMGAVSTKDPDRDLVIVKNLISGDAQCIIFPEGMMVKNKKLVQSDEFKITHDTGVSRPHTGAAVIALTTEFYRQRLRRMEKINPHEFDRIVSMLEIHDPEKVLATQTFIVPVNITYYPLRAQQNLLSSIAVNLMAEPSQRVLDELMTEGTMLLTGVDVDIRFGTPIPIAGFLHNWLVESDLTSRRRITFSNTMASRPVMKTVSIEIMERYMASVYGMTTLNYDHIFASILKYFPGPVIGVYDFKCRAFLAITGRVMESDQNLHGSLYQNQIHLLTDDRHNRFGDFIQTAVDTGRVTLENGNILKKNEPLNTNLNFHRIRIDDPVSVMANEVDPLTDVQLFLIELARKTPREISILVKNRLLQKEKADFENDYNTYFIENESKPKGVGKSIFLPSNTGATRGVLLIHGYMAAPAEMKGIAQFFNDRGYSVHAPRLKGHGTGPENLAVVSYEEWIESAEEGYAVLRHLCDKIFIGGFSTGAGIALDLATRVEKVHGVFAVAPPREILDSGAYFAPAMDIWNHLLKRTKIGTIAKDFIHHETENPGIDYLRNPIAGIRQLEKFMEKLEPKIGHIKTPVLVVQSRKDPMVKPDETAKLFKKLGCVIKEFYLLDFDRHGILLGRGAHRVYRIIAEFMDSLETTDSDLTLSGPDVIPGPDK
ncbi:EstA [Desulforapulum autotrophicum HRM2]|uniref:EstA n=1 Tax=Desulforapulum autotrophicum (strain ATCC 43914 / DSM 3382 / VKM B-1955 / HRM2) TaxID=177437 RepID=C0QG11_DESAH|nr:alpha/beta fold hydrolase [Desulforapulum autotrophicum]ACN15579.1 EstA [Desulforapulum autotrophicum HRM2]